MPKYLTKKEAAELLRMTESTLDGYRRKGILPYIKMGIRSNSKVMFDEADLSNARFNGITFTDTMY